MSYNTDLQSNNIELQGILDTIYELPEAGTSGSNVIRLQYDPGYEMNNVEEVYQAYQNGKYIMQMVLGEGKNPPKWEECGWDQPAPQLSALEIELPSVERFADNVACQHYIITYGDNRSKIKDLCSILGIEVFEM